MTLSEPLASCHNAGRQRGAILTYSKLLLLATPTVENVELYNEPNLDALQSGCSNVAATWLDNLRIRSQAMQVRILCSPQSSRRFPRSFTSA